VRRGLLVPVIPLLACSVDHPPGWPDGQVAGEAITATRGVMYSVAPRRWDVPGGEVIRVDVEAFEIVSGWGRAAAALRFSAAYVGDPDPGIVCATEPTGPGVPETRFGCWSPADPAALQLWLAPGADCPARQPLRTLARPECWQGESVVHGRRIRLRHGHLRRNGWPVGNIAWVDEDGRALLAADIVREQQFHLYPGPAEPTPEQRRALVLLTVAFAWYEHATSAD
jgi:hypothetical protein